MCPEPWFSVVLTASKSMKSLAPQVGFEPTTLRLTAERLLVASRCKHKHLQARKRVFAGNWGDFGGYCR